MQESAGIYTDSDADALVVYWVEGLIEGEQTAVQELITLPADCGFDLQRARQLARQCQQESKIPQLPHQASAPLQLSEDVSESNSLSDSAVESSNVNAAEDQGSQLAETFDGEKALSMKVVAKKKKVKRASSRTQLNRYLRPIAMKVVTNRARLPGNQPENQTVS